MGEIELSDYGRASSVPSPVNRMMGDFASDFRDGVDINLGVGYVNEDTIPGEAILRAMDAVIHQPERHRLSLNYGGPAGSANLVGAVRRFLIDSGVGGLTEQALSDRRIIIGPNGASSLLESIAYVLPRGIAVTTDPMYYIYTDFLRRRGFELLTVPEDGEGIRTDVLAGKLAALGGRAEQVRFFYVVTVNNPTCVILSNRRRRELVAAASGLSQRLGRSVPVVFDRAYEDLVHDPEAERMESGLCFDADGLVYEIGTLSKVLAPALRIGYMIGRDGPFLAACVQRTSDAGFSAPMITQEIAARLLDGHVAAQLRRVRAGYRRKALAVRAAIDEHLGGQIEALSGGRAGFYFYLTFRAVETHERSPFFRWLVRTTGDESVDGAPAARKPRVIYIPGEFCVNPHGELAGAARRQLRLSYGFEDTEAIGRAVALMGEAARYALGPTAPAPGPAA